MVKLSRMAKKIESRKLPKSYSKAIVDTIRTPLLLLDDKLSIRLANVAYYERFSVTSENIDDKLFFETGKGMWNSEELHEKIMQVLDEKKPFWDFEVEKEFPDIGYKVFLLSGRYLYSEETDEEMVLIAMDEITERKLAESQKDDFIGIVIHEIKNPLTSIKGFMQLLQQHHRQMQDQKSNKLLAKIDAQLLRLTDLMTSFLNVYKIQIHELEMNRESFSIDTLIRETVDSFSYNKENIPIEIKSKVQKNVCADRERITQVLSNLISNALKYSPREEKVIVSAERNGEHVTIRVIDCGPGIPKNQQKRIFERFYRIKKNDGSNLPGLGLGLYLSREIIKKHQQEIWVEDNENKGATFCFTLPIYESQNLEKKRQAQKKEIWVVDDDESILEMLEILLTQENYAVKTFSCGKDLLNHLNKENKPDAILLDIVMRDSNGNDVTKKIKRGDELAEIPVVLMSANVNIKEMANDSKADMYIAKPFDIDVLLSVIKVTVNKDK
jgi:signal transduction histidine kinase/ActR/RegA family two-component response regulator